MAIDRHLWVVGAMVLGGTFMLMGMQWFGLAMLALIGFWAFRDVTDREKQAEATPEYFAVSWAQRITMTLAYVGLTAFLLFAIATN